MAARRPLSNVSGVIQEIPSGDTVPSACLPLVSSTIAASSISSGTAVALDASTGGNIRNITATANVLLSAPTSPTDGQQLRVNVLASTAARTVTFSGISVSSGLSLGPYSIPQDQIGLFLLTYSTLRTTSAWVLTAATVSS